MNFAKIAIGLAGILLAAMPAFPALHRNVQIKELPQCNDLAGVEIDWTRFTDKTIIILCYKDMKDYSFRGLEQVAQKLNEERGLREKVALAVINYAAEDPVRAIAVLESSKFEFCLISNAEKVQFDGFKAIAFPTAFILDPQRRLVYAAKGYGPSFSRDVMLAALYATGEIDAQTLEERIAGKLSKTVPPDLARLKRIVESAYRNASVGEIEKAMTLLENGIAKYQIPEGELLPAVAMEAMARLLLLQVQANSSLPLEEMEQLAEMKRVNHWMSQLEQFHPEFNKLPLLRCRLCLVRGQVGDAGRHLKGIRSLSFPEVRFLKARILEVKGESKQAAAAYRLLLEKQVLTDL
jgi:hypothetical protein